MPAVSYFRNFNKEKEIKYCIRTIYDRAWLGSGDIVIMHMNHPEGETAEGVIAAIPILQKQGYEFKKLSEVIKKI